MRFFYTVFFLVLMSCHSICHSTCRSTPYVSQSNSAILDVFFRTLFEKSEAGYVLYGKKPVCIIGFRVIDILSPNSYTHRTSVALKEGACVWKRISPKESNILVHVYDHNDSLAKNCIHVLVINKRLFHKTVQENLPLFQYVLGPDVTPEKLLDALIAKDASFSSVFKNDNVLIGIILGFGTQNSLYGSRMEFIQDYLMSGEHPPFRQNIDHLPEEYQGLKDVVLFFSQQSQPQTTARVSPSFGYQTLKEEFHELTRKTQLSSHVLVNENPPFHFAMLKNDSYNAAFVKELEVTQSKIRELLHSPNFLKNVLTEVMGEEVGVDIPEHFNFSFGDRGSRNISRAVAQNIWNSIMEYQDDYIDQYLSCFISPHFENEVVRCLAFHPQFLRSISVAKENADKANQFFSTIAKDDCFQCVIPERLYYRILSAGNGPGVSEETIVSLEYKILDSNNNLISSTDVNGNKNVIDLSEMIPGFAHGIKGMKTGEKRILYIHPTLAYGVGTFSNKCMFLIAEVELLEIISKGKKSFPQIRQCPLDFLFDLSFTGQCKQEHLNAAKQQGSAVGKHFEKMGNLKKNLIVELVHRLRKSDNNSPHEEQGTESLINKIHWNIYFGS